MRRKSSSRGLAGNLALIGMIVLALALLASLFSFYRTRNILPANVFLGEVNVGGLTVDAAINRIKNALAEPLVLRHQDRITPMVPKNIDLGINENTARVSLNDVLSRQQGIANFPGWLISRNVIPAAVRLPMPLDFSPSKLTDFVAELGKEIDRKGRAPMPGVPGQDGLQLAQREAADMIAKSLGWVNQRSVDLPVDVIPADPQRLKSIAAAINPALDTFTKAEAGNVAGIYIKDLRTGEEYSSNAEVAFSASGWERLMSMIDSARTNPLEGPQFAAAKSALTAGDDAALINLLRSSGKGDAAAGINQLNATLKKLGLADTYFAQIPGQRSEPMTMVTAANSRSEKFGMRIQRDAQSTPANVGLLLEFIEQCRQGGGPLPLALGAQFNKQSCETMLLLLGDNDQAALLAAGSGDSQVFRRQSWDTNTHADAALVRDSTGSYVIVLALYSPNPLAWNQSAEVMKNVSTKAYTYFNAGRAPTAKAPVKLPPPP